MSVRDHVAIYRRTISRPRAPVICRSSRRACASARCSNGSETELVTEYSAELNLGGDASAVVTRTLQRGEYLIEAREHRDRRAHDGRRGRSGAPSSKIESRATARSLKVVSFATPGELRGHDAQRRSPHQAGPRARCESHAGSGAADARAGELRTRLRCFRRGRRTGRARHARILDRAADKLHEAVAHFEAADDEPMRAQAAYSLAYVQYGPRNEWAAAVRATEIATEAYESVGRRSGHSQRRDAARRRGNRTCRRDECRHAARRAARVVRQLPIGASRRQPSFSRVTRCRCARNTPSTCAPCWP